MLRSPLTERLCSAEVGLPRGFLTGDMLSPLIDPEMLFGGEVSGPCEDTGDLIGDGDRLTPLDPMEVSPARCIESRLLFGGTCSAWTTSANDIKLRRRTSAESSEP